MKLNLLWITILLGNCILLALTHILNNSLFSWNIHLYLFAPFIIFPILSFLPFSYGLLSIIITALFYDSVEPIKFGTSLLLFSITYTSIHWFRNRFKAYSNRHLIIFTHSANTFIIIALSSLNAGTSISSFSFWITSLINILISSAILALISNWFFDLQSSLLKLSGYKNQIDGKNLV